MTPSQYESFALLLGMAALFGGVVITRQGSAVLSESQAAELRAMGPDPLATVGPLVMGGAAYMSRQYTEVLMAVVVITMAVVLWRVPYRQWKMTWPLAARIRLVIGNCVLNGGLAAACLFYMSQYL